MVFSKTWTRIFFHPITLLAAVLAVVVWVSGTRFVIAQSAPVDTAAEDATKMFNDGRQIFRFDTFGDEAFWGDTLKLHQAIQGSALSREWTQPESGSWPGIESGCRRRAGRCGSAD